MHNYTINSTKLKLSRNLNTEFKFTQIFLYSIRIESNLQEKQKENKITEKIK
jgi:hypothetical protein